MATLRVGIRSRTAVLESDPDGTQPIYAATLLKVALRLKRARADRAEVVAGGANLDVLLDQLLEDSAVDGLAFRAYLARNYSLLLGSLGRKHT
jgi:hypothetical protein